METYDRNLERQAHREKRRRQFNSRSGHVWGGLVLLAVGSLLLAHEVGVNFPRWFFSWEMLVIAIGVYIGARHSFRSWGWLIPVAVGTAFLVDDIVPDLNFRQFIWPTIIIAIGLIMILRPRRKRDSAWTWDNHQNPAAETAATGDDLLDTVSIFGGTKKNIISKNFRGGDVVTFFGGTEINLTQADINGVVMLDITQVFGGTKLIVPSNWKIQSDLVSVFGGVDDKRNIQTTIDPNKTLVLDGTCIFGGIEIKSY